LVALLDAGHRDEGTLSLLARTYKDRWQLELEPDRKRELLRRACDYYRQGYDYARTTASDSGLIYAGVNASTTALLLGDVEYARQTARHVAHACESKVDLTSDYWALATLGECALIAGRIDEAAAYYQQAANIEKNNFADIASTCRNALMLAQHMGLDFDQTLGPCFRLPNVGLFSGHLTDCPGKTSRFPHREIDRVRRELEQAVHQANMGFAYSSAACGGDLLFRETVQRSGGGRTS